jgi:hypothetical protein
MAGPRNYTQSTIKKLFALSGNLCAFPGCNKRLVNDKNALDSCICHIEAAKPGGERYNPKMTNEERAGYNNLILLCPQHHAETNNIEKYTVAVMKKIKREHESQYLNERLNQNTSMLKNVIYAIAEINLQDKPDTPVLNIFDPNEKIVFNELKENAGLIKEYRVYQAKLNTLYDELESQGSIKKEKLLENIKLIYIKIKGRYVQNEKNTISIIKNNSDAIFDSVYEALSEKLTNSGLFDEDVFVGLRIIMVDAFMRCKILEDPDVTNHIEMNMIHKSEVNYDNK